MIAMLLLGMTLHAYPEDFAAGNVRKTSREVRLEAGVPTRIFNADPTRTRAIVLLTKYPVMLYEHEPSVRCERVLPGNRRKLWDLGVAMPGRSLKVESRGAPGAWECESVASVVVQVVEEFHGGVAD